LWQLKAKANDRRRKQQFSVAAGCNSNSCIIIAKAKTFATKEFLN